MSIRVALVDDSPEIRETVISLLHSDNKFECVAAFESGEQALKKVFQHSPDVVLMDIRLPGISGVECTQRMKEQLPNVQIMMLTMFENDDYVFNSLVAGASGYVTKRTKPEKLLSAIEDLYNGGSPMSPDIARKVVQTFRQFHLPTSATEDLTKRETEILSYLTRGMRYQEIADALFLSVETVRRHIHHIYQKLHVRTRGEAVMKTMGR